MWLRAFDPVIHQMMIIFTCVPLAGNLVAYAARLNLQPEKVATVILLSSLAAIVILPAALLGYQYLFMAP